MFDVQGEFPAPLNEPAFDYRPHSAERERLKESLGNWTGHNAEIPLIIGRPRGPDRSNG